MQQGETRQSCLKDVLQWRQRY